jgi:DNA-binding NarL/FixJ family response regulator
MARVVIGDAHGPTRTGIRHVLSADGFDVVAEAATADALVEAATAHRPDLCLVDVALPGGGIAAVAAVRAAVPETASIMLTAAAHDDELFDALRAGACGYLTKDISADRLPAALRGVLAGEAALPRSLVATLVGAFQDRSRRRRSTTATASLSQREWDVLDLLGQGHTTAEIAARLAIAPATVRTHVAAAVHKLGATDRRDAVRRARALARKGTRRAR